MSSGDKAIIGTRRAELLDVLREAQHRERASLSPSERLERAEATRALGLALHGRGNARGDESPELLLRIRAAFRERQRTSR